MQKMLHVLDLKLSPSFWLLVLVCQAYTVSPEHLETQELGTFIPQIFSPSLFNLCCFLPVTSRPPHVSLSSPPPPPRLSRAFLPRPLLCPLRFLLLLSCSGGIRGSVRQPLRPPVQRRRRRASHFVLKDGTRKALQRGPGGED